MAVKLSGLNFNYFMTAEEPWEGDAWMEEEELLFDGKPWEDGYPAPISSVVTIKSGTIRRTGDREDESLVVVARRWLKKQNTARLIVEVPRDKEAAARALIGSGRFKIVN